MKGIISTAVFLTLLFYSFDAAGQLIMPYTIQGFLKDGGVPANGNYDISYALYETETGGAIVGGNNHLNVPVTAGVFSFTEPAYATFHTPGRTLWIEFGFKPAYSQQPYTIVAPRQRLGAVPFSISSLLSADSLKLGGTNASQFVLTGDPRLSDARPPTAGSTNYIQNNTAGQTANFKISGTGAANILSANEFFLGENKLISNGGFLSNVFFGVLAGQSNTSGSNNLFLGTAAGAGNTIGLSNSFVGGSSGGGNTNGSNNSFFGSSSGSVNSTGSGNTFIGRLSGLLSATGNNNTALGFRTSVADGLTNATALGSQASVTQSNALVLGSINGVNGATADTFVGIGTTTPAAKLHVNGSVRVTNGGIFVSNPNTLVITSPNGACWGITVNNSGGLATFPVNPCP